MTEDTVARDYEAKECDYCGIEEDLDDPNDEFQMCGHCGNYYCHMHESQETHDCEFSEAGDD